MNRPNIETRMAQLNRLILARQQRGLSPYTIDVNGRPDLRIVQWSITDSSAHRSATVERKLLGFNRLPRLVGSHVLAGLYGMMSFDVMNTVPGIAVATPAREIYAFRASSAEQLNAIGVMVTREANYNEFVPEDLIEQKFPK